MVKYSLDKLGRPESDNENPAGEDCSTQEKKTQAWTTRVQKLVSARDNFMAGAKYGCKGRQDENGRWY